MYSNPTLKTHEIKANLLIVRSLSFQDQLNNYSQIRSVSNFTMVYSKKTKFAIAASLVFILVTVPVIVVWYQSGYSYLNPCQMHNFLVDSQEAEASLFLTPFIKSGRVAEGRLNALVATWFGVNSFSGFITVNETSNSNLFFWFFPVSADYNSSKQAPVILYLQGGPGMSSMFGLFLEVGPFRSDSASKHFKIEKNAFSWTSSHSVVFVDSPVDTGYSFTDDKSSRVKGQDDVSRDLYEFLVQFFTLFSDYQANDFYIAGTSYAGKYIPTLAYKVDQENRKAPEGFINLKGLAIGGGFFEAEIQDKFSDYNYYLGFIDERQMKLGKSREANITQLVQDEQFFEAREETINLKLDIWTKWAGWLNILSGSALEMELPKKFQHFQTLLKSNCAKGGLHVGKYVSYNPLSLEVRSNFDARDYFYSTRGELEALLDADYRILFIASQFDMVVLHVGIARFLDSLRWKRSADYLAADRKIWWVPSDRNHTIGGYVKEVPGITYLLIRNAGHMPCNDNPAWCLDMINRFTDGRSFITGD